MFTRYLANWALVFTLLTATTGITLAQSPGPTPPPSTLPDQMVPTTITLNQEEILAEDAFQQISVQTGVQFSTQPRNLFKQDQYQIPKTIKVNKQNFWPALKEICETFNVYPQVSSPGIIRGEPLKINLIKGVTPWGKRPICTTDFFLITANSIARNVYIDLSNPEGDKTPDDTPVYEYQLGQTSVQFTVFADPKLRLGPVFSQLVITEATDENGLSLLTPTEKRPRPFAVLSSSQHLFAWEARANLMLPENVGKRIATLKGTLQAPVYTKIEKWEVPDILNAKDVSKKFGNVTYTIKKVTVGGPDNNKTYAVELSAAVPLELNTNGQPIVGPRAANVIMDTSTAQLLDADGKTYPLGAGYNGRGEYTPGTETRLLKFTASNRRPANDANKPGEPVKFTMEIPTETKNLTIPVSFTDLPLP